MRDMFETAGKWVGGLCTVSTPYWIGEISLFDQHSKSISIVLGCVLTVVFIVSGCFDIRKKWRNRNNP